MNASAAGALRDAFLAFAHPNGMRFEATERPDELLAKLTLYDLEYRGLFLWFVPMRSYDIYWIRVRFDEPSAVVLLQEERETYLKSWTNVKKDVFKGVYLRARESDALWGRRADGSLGNLYRFELDSDAVKNPVRTLVGEHGWTLNEKKFT